MNKTKRFDAKDRATARTLLPIVALGGGLAAAPAAALELGDLTVQSNLGQPLRASIAYALAPNEMLSDTCVSVSAGQSTSGLPAIGSSTVRITERAIIITGETAIREPMLGTRVTVNCPYTPNLSREYMLFVDPARVAETRAAAAPVARPEPVASTQPAAQPVAEAPARRRTPVDTTPIGQATRYQVQPGDTLGDIVRRIENRSMGLWPAVNRVFEANPEAFADNDPNRIKAGTWLTIPSFDGTAPVVEPASAAQTAAPEVPETTVESTSATESLATDAMADVAASEVISAYDPTMIEDLTETPAEEPVVRDSTADLRPGDVILGGTTADTRETIVIPDTELEGPQTTSTSPNVPTAIVSTGSRNESTSMLAWLAGGGLFIIGALVLFGRRLRGGFGSTPVGPVAEKPQRRATDHAVADTEYDIDDDSPTAENLILDADLVTGSGFEHGTDVDINQDFGFAATTELDIELPFEPQAPADDSTDIIPPMRDSMESILESEVLPEDDDYDMSVIMDATKMPQPEDVTERDLKAVEVGSGDETLIADNYTISKEVDYDILEQDYEEELSATQALNLEIERAAAELAENLGEETDKMEVEEKTAEMPADEATAEMPLDEATAEMPLAPVTEIDATAELPVKDNEKTAEFEASYDPDDTNALTVNMSSEDKTAEMPVANDDDTTEMEISGGTVDTKRLG